MSDGPLLLDLPDRPGGLRLLAIGAHADDIEIGAGGTILRLAGEGRLGAVHWMVLSARDERAAEARAGAAAFLEGVASVDVVLGEFRDAYFPYVGEGVKDAIEAARTAFEPDLILTHRRADVHQDHRLVAELTWNAFRHHLILEYEIPKYEGDLGAPNVFVSLDESVVERKIKLIESTYRSQRARTWFDPELFRALLRLRGLESGTGRFAEGFTARKLAL